MDQPQPPGMIRIVTGRPSVLLRGAWNAVAAVVLPGVCLPLAKLSLFRLLTAKCRREGVQSLPVRGWLSSFTEAGEGPTRGHHLVTG